MSDTYLLVGLFIGIATIVLYLIITSRSTNRTFDLAEAVRLFFASVGIATSCKVGIMALTATQLGTASDTDRLYIFIGGLAALWVCIQTSIRVLSQGSKRVTAGTVQQNQALSTSATSDTKK